MGTLKLVSILWSTLIMADQMKQLNDTLKKFDTNGDGKISFFEFVSFMSRPEISKLFGAETPFTLDLLTKIFKDIDADESKFIDHKEFLSVVKEKTDGTGNLEIVLKLD